MEQVEGLQQQCTAAEQRATASASAAEMAQERVGIVLRQAEDAARAAADRLAVEKEAR